MAKNPTVQVRFVQNLETAKKRRLARGKGLSLLAIPVPANEVKSGWYLVISSVEIQNKLGASAAPPLGTRTVCYLEGDSSPASLLQKLKDAGYTPKEVGKFPWTKAVDMKKQ